MGLWINWEIVRPHFTGKASPHLVPYLEIYHTCVSTTTSALYSASIEQFQKSMIYCCTMSVLFQSVPSRTSQPTVDIRISSCKPHKILGNPHMELGALGASLVAGAYLWHPSVGPGTWLESLKPVARELRRLRVPNWIVCVACTRVWSSGNMGSNLQNFFRKVWRPVSSTACSA